MEITLKSVEMLGPRKCVPLHFLLHSLIVCCCFFLITCFHRRVLALSDFVEKIKKINGKFRETTGNYVDNRQVEVKRL